jgi:hypothetical protein
MYKTQNFRGALYELIFKYGNAFAFESLAGKLIPFARKERLFKCGGKSLE